MTERPIGKKGYEKLRTRTSVNRAQIAVLGSSKIICTPEAYEYAYEVGRELAKFGAIVVTGGGLGVMEAAMKGAKSANGKTLAIVPWENRNKVNNYADFVVATGIGWSRNSININSCDGAIIVGGGAGTLNEATYGYMMTKPIVALTPSGGTAAEITNRYFDVRKTEYIFGSNTPKEAVKLVMKLAKKGRRISEKISELDKDLLEREEKLDWKLIQQAAQRMRRKNAKR